MGSYVDGTYTSSSDLDLCLPRPKRYGDSTEISTILHRNRLNPIVRDIRSRTLIEFSVSDITVNLVLNDASPTGPDTSARMRTLSSASPVFVKIVRFLKTVGSLYVDRFPSSSNRSAVIPGSYFFPAAAAICFGTIGGSGYGYRSHSLSSIPLASVEYVEGVKRVCHFIGSGDYKNYGSKFDFLEISLARFTDSFYQRKFEKVFQRVLMCIEQGTIPAELSLRSRPSRAHALSQLELLVATQEKKKEEEEREKIEREMRRREKERKGARENKGRGGRAYGSDISSKRNLYW